MIQTSLGELGNQSFHRVALVVKYLDGVDLLFGEFLRLVVYCCPGRMVDHPKSTQPFDHPSHPAQVQGLHVVARNFSFQLFSLSSAQLNLQNLCIFTSPSMQESQESCGRTEFCFSWSPVYIIIMDRELS